MEKKERLFFLIYLIFWMIYILYPFYFEKPGGISADGLYYVHMARNIVYDFELGWPGSFTCPLYSIFMAILYPLSGDVALSGVWVTKISALLFPVAVFLLSKELFGFKVAIFSVILSSFHPHILFIAKHSGYVEPEMLYITLQILAFYFIWIAFKRERWYFPILAGLFSALAYLTRSEGLMVFFLALFSVLILLKREAKLKLNISLIIVVVFFLTSLPYLLFLKNIYGGWVFSPKFSNVIIGADQYFYDVKKRRPVPEFWSLTKEGKFAWQEKKGISDLIEYLKKDPKTQWENYKEGLKYIFTMKIPNSSGMDYFPSVFPWYFFIPALLYLIVFLKKPEERLKSIFLFSFYPILFVLNILSGVWWKYLVAYSPFLIMLSVAYFERLSEKINFKYLSTIFIVIVFIYSYTSYTKTTNKPSAYVSMKGNYERAQKNAAVWAKKFLKPNANYMLPWSKIIYFLDGKWILLPESDYNGLYWYAKKNKVDYIVVEVEGRGGEAAIIAELGNVPFLEIVGVYREIIEDKTQTYIPIEYAVMFVRVKQE